MAGGARVMCAASLLPSTSCPIRDEPQNRDPWRQVSLCLVRRAEVGPAGRN